jgi:hypothetical protein
VVSPTEDGSFFAQLRRLERILAVAQAHVAAHHHAAAYALLAPYAREAPEPVAGQFFLLLGRCAIRGHGRDWLAPLQRARQAFASEGDAVGLACVQANLGAAHAARGELQQAQVTLREAIAGLGRHRMTHGMQLGEAQRLQAEVALWCEQTPAAQYAVQAALATSAELGDAVAEALARLMRAQVASAAGHMPQAAYDMLWAERLTQPDWPVHQKVQIGLGRAASLIQMGCSHRAAAGLAHLQASVHAAQDPLAQAHFGRLMGTAQLVDAPAVAHMHLESGGKFFLRARQNYYWAQCALGLVRCAHRLGLPTAPVLSQLAGMPLRSWPVLRKEMESVQAQVSRPPGRLTGPLATLAARAQRAD